MNSTPHCSCQSAPKLIFACSGAADVGGLADRAARQMTLDQAGKMKRNLLSLGLFLLMAMLPAGAADNLKPAAASTNAPNRQIIAYYFHGTLRCETCQKIEQQARAVIERRFKAELDAQRLVFKPVNYDLPENAHFLQDYKLPCPSLVLVCRDNGKDAKGTLLGKTWDLIGDEAKFNRYIETEVTKSLRSQKPAAGNGNIPSP